MIAARLAYHYHFGDREILDMPLRRALLYARKLSEIVREVWGGSGKRKAAKELPVDLAPVSERFAMLGQLGAIEYVDGEELERRHRQGIKRRLT